MPMIWKNEPSSTRMIGMASRKAKKMFWKISPNVIRKEFLSSWKNFSL